ncbi:MAG: methyltransferase domain-containing protein [Candidatus Krumholzibacteriia bacterium]
MRLKADWQTYLHQLRRREFDLVFGRCPAGAFGRGLELGAGDGYASDLLTQCVGELLVTDFYAKILALPARPGRRTQVLDAEAVGAAFPAGSFDLVFSSNLLEHLPDLPRALAGIHHVLADDGLSIHVLPSAFWKVCQVACFYPDILLSRLDRYGRGQLPQPLRRLLPAAAAAAGSAPVRNNNPKVDDGSQDWVHRFLVPPIHGAVGGHLRELRRFRQRQWREMFARAGFTIVAVIPGPATSSYGFGLGALRRFCEARGWVSEYAWVTVKSGRTSPLARHFTGGNGAV